MLNGVLAIDVNAGLLSVGAVAAILISTGFVVYLSDMGSITHRFFLALTGTSVVWSLFNYAIYQSSSPLIVLWFLRMIMFTAVWFAYSLFTFFFVFPDREHPLPRWYRLAVLPATLLVSVITLTPLVFTAVSSFSVNGQVTQVVNGPGIILFGILVLMLDIGALFFLVQKTLRAQGAERRPYRLILLGTFATILLILAFSFILPAFLGNSSFVAFGTLFLLPFIGLTAYAIYTGRVLNVKEIGTALLVSALAIATLLELIFTTDPILILFRTSLFVLILIVGLLLARGVVKEVEQRERIEKLAVELEDTNQRQENLIRFISHEVKNFLTKDMGAFAALSEGDFGALPDGMKPFVDRALTQSRDSVTSVLQILKASNQKKGTVEYTKEPLDLDALAAAAVAKLREHADAKGLTLTYAADEAGKPYTVSADKVELGDHVLGNLVDNSINYTPSGSINVTLSRKDGKAVFAVKDTGVGITDEDKARLFTEGGHGKESQKINVHSTGYGLFIAKNIVTAHGGTIRAESEGKDRGSTFIVELPLVA
ncbi:hypothetical protein KGQ55_00710 [Patescibacteria group bacterium]|nr:hypothetical protein [Patescibacteria group bacterium]